jgi:hypothetical protein
MKRVHRNKEGTMAQLFDRKHPGPGRWWVLLFSGPRKDDLPGMAFVEADSTYGAVEEAAARASNPGRVVEVHALIGFGPPSKWSNRFLGVVDILKMGFSMLRPNWCQLVENR